MEEKLRAANGQSGEPEAGLLQRCQELQAAVREKDATIARLGQQLEEQVGSRPCEANGNVSRPSNPLETGPTPRCQVRGGESGQDQGMGDAETLRGTEPASGFGRSPTRQTSHLFILQFEVENGALREANRQQDAQVEELKKQLQGSDLLVKTKAALRGCVEVTAPFRPDSPAAFEQKRGGAPHCPGEAQRLSSLTFGCFQVKAKNPQVLTGPEPSQRTLSSQESEGQNGKASYVPSSLGRR